MEGVVKFNCHWNQSGPVISDEQYEIINYWREILFNMDLIGAYENGVGFGNISMRIKGRKPVCYNRFGNRRNT